MIVFFYKSIRKVLNKLLEFLEKLITVVVLSGNGVHFGAFRTHGIPYIVVAGGAEFYLGNKFTMNNGIRGNPIGCYDKCTFFVDRGAKLVIGDNVGISQAAIVCHKSIVVQDNVKIGGGVKIYDTDFHSLDPSIRASKDDTRRKKTAPILIKNNAFIGAFSIVLKGVTIGENSIVGAGSVVTKSIPDNEIWAGNPAKFIRKI
ncbi:acyltransferase [Sphingobacterium sp. DN00404]|uniref:Acyltransferase n=1 Tax=Sphingobacterium micropteri TaxID=2763501 RepID=A0ABR7YK87_9SPHI|nr:acyltransferase [Sphingobacterium micropteri]MBD1431745.1 acyltransferase [Sphingobacterium micropteri]